MILACMGLLVGGIYVRYVWNYDPDQLRNEASFAMGIFAIACGKTASGVDELYAKYHYDVPTSDRRRIARSPVNNTSKAKAKDYRTLWWKVVRGVFERHILKGVDMP